MGAPPSPSRRSGGSFLLQYFLVILSGFGFVSLYVHSSLGHGNANPMQAFQSQHFSVASVSSQQQQQQQPEHLKDAVPKQIAAPVEKLQGHADAESKDKEVLEKEHHEELIQAHEAQIQRNEDRAEKPKEAENKKETLEERGHKLAAQANKPKEAGNEKKTSNEDAKILEKKDLNDKAHNDQALHQKAEGVKTKEEGHKLAAQAGKPKEGENEKKTVQEDGHQLAGLDCSAHGGPSNDKAAEMVYWSDIPSDNAHVSPFYDSNKYMTFEPDPGGWNNIRMSMESVLAMAVAMGRTLVLPPKQGMYLLDKDEHKKDNQFSFNDFYHLESIANEHGGLNIITMEQFLKEQAMAGKSKDASGKVLFPPGNRTDWSASKRYQVGELLKYQDGALTQYLRTISHWPDWDSDKCLAAFPASKDPADLQKLKDLKAKIETGGDEKYTGWNAFEMFVGKPTPVDAPAEERAKEMWALRKTLCIYDEEMQKAPLIHFGVEHQKDGVTVIKGARMLIHFYAFLFFENWKQDLWMKRFVRDHVRYIDEIQCAAARVVNAVRDRARKRHPASNGEYDAFHIRRGDFQYTETRVDADKIYAISKDELTSNTTIYIGTDERDRAFFKPLADHYDIVFLDDFKHLVKDVNSNYYGMLDQLITSRSRVFFGCFWSSFTGHINRIRGYQSVNKKLPGYQDGALPSTYYYAQEEHKLQMHDFVPVKIPFWSREYPTAWRDIDKSIGQMTMVS